MRSKFHFLTTGKKTVKPIAQTATKDRTLQPEKPTELQKYIIKSHVKKGTW